MRSGGAADDSFVNLFSLSFHNVLTPTIMIYMPVNLRYCYQIQNIIKKYSTLSLSRLHRTILFKNPCTPG